MANRIATALLVTTVALAATFARAGVPVVWTTDTFKVKPLAYECYHGETLDLAAAVTAYGEPLALSGKTAKLFWQTPDMGETWYETNATIRADAETGATNVLAATFSGAFDTGKERVNGFIGVVGENYRAAFELRFRASPGFVPHELPLPAKTIDCAKVTFLNPTNAPWSTGGGGGGGLVDDVRTNGVSIVSSKVADIYGPVRAIASSASVTNAGAVAVAAADATAKVVAATNDASIVRYEGGGLKHGDTAVTASDVGAVPASTILDMGNDKIIINKNLVGIGAAQDGKLFIRDEDAIKYGTFEPGGFEELATIGDIPSQTTIETYATNAVANSDNLWNQSNAKLTTRITQVSEPIAEQKVSEVMEYGLTNLTANTETVELASGIIGNLALDNAHTNINLTLAYPTANDKSSDILLRVICAADTTLAINSENTDVDGTEWTSVKAGTNYVTATRTAFVGGRSKVLVAIKEVK